MIICHKYKFIFIKTRKTAGTSIEIALSQFCGKDDIITPISRKDEPIRVELGYPGPQNFKVPLPRYTAKDWFNLVSRRRRRKFYNHMQAQDIRKYIDREVWNTYFKFCFERNPWDKALSLYYWQIRGKETKLPFSEHLKSVEASRLSNFHIYAINGEVAVNHVALYENLDQELKEISERLKLPEQIILPTAKGSARQNRQHYRELMGEEERALIEKTCFQEINHWGYCY
jgi:Sulfotransferase family